VHQVVVKEHERADRHETRVKDEFLDVGPPVKALVRHGDIDDSFGVAERFFGLVAGARFGRGLKDALQDVLCRLA
jgi:hypothetical protein